MRARSKDRGVFSDRVGWVLVLAAVLATLVPAGSGLTALAQNPTGTLPPKIDPKGQDLLDRAIQSLGGPLFLDFKRLTTRGRIYAIEEGETAGLAPFTSQVEYPDKRRLSYGKKKPVILINNGDDAFELDKYGRTHQLPEQIRRWKLSKRYSLENLLRIHIKEVGILIQAGGVDFIDNSRVLFVDIIDPQNVQVRIYVHQQTFLPVRIIYRVQNPKTREWEEYADVYGDYQKFQGIETPMHITHYLDGQRISETYRTSAKYDENYPPDTFGPGA